MKKQPEKTAQTKQSIIDAFWNIANKRGLDKVTISEVTKCAGLNRGTFYVYFSDIDDLLCQAEQEIVSELRNKLGNILINEEVFSTPFVSSKILEIFGLYNDKFFMLLGQNGDPRFLDMVRKEAAGVFNLALKMQQPIPYQEYIIAYITSAFIGLLQFWHESGRNIPLDKLSKLAHFVALHGIIGLKEQNRPTDKAIC